MQLMFEAFERNMWVALNKKIEKELKATLNPFIVLFVMNEWNETEINYILQLMML